VADSYDGRDHDKDDYGRDDSHAGHDNDRMRRMMIMIIIMIVEMMMMITRSW